MRYFGKWPDGGAASTHAYADTWAEAAGLLPMIQADIAADPDATVAVMARTQRRRRELEAAAREADMAFELWDHPVHRPRVVQLLRKHLPMAVARSDDGRERFQELYNLCFEACDQDDLETVDELNEAFEAIEDLIVDQPLAQVIGGVRTAAAENLPVAAGLHFLTGHSGKGQQFDHVYVLGLEDGILPDYRANTPETRREELAVLHVMVSRARRGSHRDQSPRRQA